MNDPEEKEKIVKHEIKTQAWKTENHIKNNEKRNILISKKYERKWNEFY